MVLAYFLILRVRETIDAKLRRASFRCLPTSWDKLMMQEAQLQDFVHLK